MRHRRQQDVKAVEGPSDEALTERMTPLLVIVWAALATAMNIGIGRWCRAADARSARAETATR
jgi:hypothetical protein